MPSRILHLYPQFSIMYQIFPKKEKKKHAVTTITIPIFPQYYTRNIVYYGKQNYENPNLKTFRSSRFT